MDDFKDLDQEIEHLKKQLNFGGEGGAAAPEINDYWKRRLDEEKILFAKRMDARKEEKKALEFKIGQQQSQIEQYHQSLKDLEKKFEQESSQWEERLRVKEADLLIEKNRVLNEEKVKEAEIETRRMLAQVAELNSKIAHIRDEQAIEIQRLNENFETERQAFAEKREAAAQQGALLEKRIKELEQDIAARTAELEKTKAAYDQKLKDADAKIGTLSAERETLDKGAKSLADQLDEQQKKAADEKRQLQVSYKNLTEYFVGNLRKNFGPLVGLVHFVAKHRVTDTTWDIFRDLIQKVDSETESFSVQSNVTYIYNEPFPALVALPDSEYPVWKSALVNTRAEVRRVEARQLVREAGKLKPQVAIVSGRFLRRARALRRRWPFLPIIISGDLNGKTTNALLAAGYRVIVPPYVIEEMVNVVTHAAGNSIAQTDYWNKIRIKRSRLLPALALGAALLAAGGIFAGRYLNLPALELPGFSRATSFATPYPQPTNLTYDGQYLWACDWMGQSVYKHKINGELGLVRIFYFPGKHFAGLAWIRGNLWTADPWERKINRHNSDDNLTILASYDAPGSAPSGLAGDGTVLWSCDAAAGMIYRHRLDEKLTVEAAVPSPGPSPAGLYFDGTSL
jgi:hypothetical protein